MSNRNVVKHHGKLGAHGPEGGTLYTSLPMELARDGKLSYLARSVAMFIWSHDEKWQQSASAVADALGMKRDTVSKALAELQERGWLVREVHQTVGPSGKPRTTREVWHLQMSNRPFTLGEVLGLSTPKGAHETGTSPSPDAPITRARITATCPRDGHGGARDTGTLGAHETGTIEVEAGVHQEVHDCSSARDFPVEDPEGGPLASAGRYTGTQNVPGTLPESETESVSSSAFAEADAVSPELTEEEIRDLMAEHRQGYSTADAGGAVTYPNRPRWSEPIDHRTPWPAGEPLPSPRDPFTTYVDDQTGEPLPD